MLVSAAVRVPCSTSNLGAGFDCIGLALRRHLTATFEPDGRTLAPGERTLAPGERTLAPGGGVVLRDGGLVLIRRGALEALPGPAADDLVVRVFRAEAERRGAVEVAGRIVVDSEIPVGRGLGSSAAAVVAGLALAAAASGDERPDRRAALVAAERWEGHPDNVAPALLGGLIAVVRGEDGGARALRLGLSEHLGFAYAAPGATLSTLAARAALPATVPHAVAARAAGRVVALLRGLSTGDPEALRIGFADELHVPYRLPLIPGAAAVIAAAAAAGAFATTVSGSGTGLIAATRPERAEAVAAAMGQAFAREVGATGVVAFAAAPDFHGVRLLGRAEEA